MKPNSNCFSLRPATREEASLFYSDDQTDRSLGTVGHVRMDFGSSGKGFYHTWWPHNGEQFNTPEFKAGSRGPCSSSWTLCGRTGR